MWNTSQEIAVRNLMIEFPRAMRDFPAPAVDRGRTSSLVRRDAVLWPGRIRALSHGVMSVPRSTVARMPSSVEGAIQRHAVLIYFALVFLISWGGGLLILGPEGLPLRATEFDRLGALLYVAILAGPGLAGVLLTYLVSGSPGLHEMLTRLRRWRVDSRWYVVALLPGLLMTAATLLLSLVSSDFRPELLSSSDKAGIVLRALGPALLVGALEEIGWTGFAVPHLRSRHSILATGLVVGVVWGAWHFPLFWETDSFSAPLPLVILFTRLFSWLPAFRMLLIWIHDRTQSLPVVMLAHAVVSFVSIALQSHTALTGSRLLISLFVLAGSMWVLVGAIELAARVRPRSQHASTRSGPPVIGERFKPWMH